MVQQVKQENNRQRRATHYDCESDLVLGLISGSLVTDLLYERLVVSVRIRLRTRTNEIKQTPHKRMSDIKKVKARHKHSKITPESIARMMNIGLDKAIDSNDTKGNTNGRTPYSLQISRQPP